MKIPTWSFYASTPTQPFSRADIALFGLFAGMLLLVAAFWMIALVGRGKPVFARLVRRISGGFLTFGILGGLWSVIGYLEVPYLGARLCAALIVVSFLVWLFFIGKYIFTKYAAELDEWNKTQIKQKYLHNR